MLRFKRAIQRFPLTYLIQVGWTRLLGTLTANARVSPDFLIIGGQRCGTTSMYRYLLMHPYVLPSYPKEIHYFTLNFTRGFRWYRSHFPMRLGPIRQSQFMSRPFLTGEATPYYLFHPQVAKRVKRSLPEVKLIILLRDPVDRAYSHYNHEVAMGVEKLSFEKALQAESARLDGEHERLLQESHYKSFNHQHFSYLARGLYAEQLTIWREEFSQEQVHVICSEDFFRDAARSMGDVWRFLDLPKHSISDFETHNLGRYLPMKQETRDELNDYFNSHNQKLFNLLGRDYGWGLR